MSTINVGHGASSAASNAVMNNTFIDKGNPAGAAGTLTSFSVWISAAVVGYTFNWGTFYGSGTAYTSRNESADLGNIPSGSKQTFTGQNVGVSSGDFIGFYATGYLVYSVAASTTGGSGYEQYSGNAFGAGQKTYATWAGRWLGIEATGSTPAGTTSVGNLFTFHG